MKILLFLAILLVVITGLILWFVVAVEGEEKQMTATAEAQMRQILETTEPLIAFEACGVFDAANESNIEVVSLSGSLYYKLTDLPGYERTPTWSPDGKQIAFVVKGSSGKGEIFIKNLRTGKVWSSGIVKGYAPSWSYDGTRFAYGSAKGELLVSNIDGSNRYLLTSNNGQRVIAFPKWSPDDTKILFISTERDNGTMSEEVHVFDFITNTRKALTEPADKKNWEGIDYNSAAWSPDGTQIVYTIWNHTLWEGAIWIMDSDGRNKRKLPVEVEAPGEITWSPGREIAFVDRRKGTQVEDIYIVQPDGSSPRSLTSFLLPFDIGAMNPAWFNPKFARVMPKPQYPSWDLNQDGITDIADLVLFEKNWKKTGQDLLGDINGDGIVDIADVYVWLEHFGEKTGEKAVLAAPALSPQNRKLLEAIKPELTKEQIAEIFRKLQPMVKPQGKRLTTWAEVKKQ